MHRAAHYVRTTRRSAACELLNYAANETASMVPFESGGTRRGTQVRRLSSLETMAAEVIVSPRYLPRAFKTAVGQSPHRYVLARRIERAKELLRSTDMPVVDVALSSGFSSQSHLSNWFLREVGISPAAYRRQGTKTSAYLS